MDSKQPDIKMQEVLTKIQKSSASYDKNWSNSYERKIQNEVVNRSNCSPIKIKYAPTYDNKRQLFYRDPDGYNFKLHIAKRISKM